MTHQKRLSAPKHYPISRKDNTYISTVKGSRSKENAIPANVFLRDVTEYAETDKEAKKIVKQGDILRNGEKIRDVKQGIGVLDVVQLPEAEENFRVLRDGKNLQFTPTEDLRKAAKITGKKIEGDEYIYRLHNGENYRSTAEHQTQNTLIFEDQGVNEVELQEGAEVLVLSGQHAGETAQLEQINQRGMNPDTGTVSKDDTEFETELKNLVATGDLEVNN
jgi:small subunit ribosomal protein S4e